MGLRFRAFGFRIRLGFKFRVPTWGFTGLLSNQGEKSINLCFIRVLLRKKVLKYGTPKPSLGFRVRGFGFIYVVLGVHG